MGAGGGSGEASGRCTDLGGKLVHRRPPATLGPVPVPPASGIGNPPIWSSLKATPGMELGIAASYLPLAVRGVPRRVTPLPDLHTYTRAHPPQRQPR